MSTKKPKTDGITIGFMTTGNVSFTPHKTTVSTKVLRASVTPQRPVKEAPSRIIEDATELPSEEALAAAWELAPKSVREAFGYAKVGQAKRIPRV